MQFIGSINKYPSRVLAAMYTGLVALGTALLLLPSCQTEGGEAVSLLNALFTATSATCVTGLAVCSTENDFSWLGQAVILLLIQVGGIGISTLTTYAIFSLGGPASLRHRAIVTSTLGANNSVDLRWLLKYAIIVTLTVEAVGFFILLFRNLLAGLNFPYAIWHALFHSVSAFCNAGFALQDDSLMAYQGDLVMNTSIMILIVLGGIGFPVILDLQQKWNGNWRESWERLNLHSKLMLLGTASLLLLGTVSFLVLEWNNTLAEMPYGRRVMMALFHSVTCRTAGFNTVDLPSMTNAMLFVSILLMAVGAGPGSTAGGFKVTTLSILALRAWSSFRGRERISLFRRTIPNVVITQAMVTAVLFAAVATVALTILLAFEQSREPHLGGQNLFLDCVFEVISALGTVGLSVGLTPELSSAGRVVIILLMFLGRLGPITVFAALSRDLQPEPTEYSAEEPLLG